VEPEELKKLIEEDKQRRLNEMAQILQEASERLDVEIKAVIEVAPSGDAAIAKLIMRAQ